MNKYIKSYRTVFITLRLFQHSIPPVAPYTDRKTGSLGPPSVLGPTEAVSIYLIRCSSRLHGTRCDSLHPSHHPIEERFKILTFLHLDNLIVCVRLVIKVILLTS